MTTVGVAIASIPPRTSMLCRALTSALHQHRSPDAVSVIVDHDHQGAATTRNRAWRALDTDWVAFLDDDDELLCEHLGLLLGCAEANDADMVYPWFEVVGGNDPMPGHFGREWDPNEPRQTTVTCLWRRTALEKIDGFPQPADDVDQYGNRVGEEFLAVLALNAQGGRIVHLPQRTWRWHHHGANTSGRADRW